MTQRLSIKHLQVLVAFRRSGNLARIAEFLKLTPSAVSRRVEEAEARLGVALFAKASNRIRLTPAGEYVVRTAERILADLERAESVAAHLGGDVRDLVRIGMATYRNFGWVPGFAAHLAASAPEIGIELAVGADAGEADALTGQVTDVLITPFDAAPDTEPTDLFADDLVALVAPGHRLTGRQFISPADVETEVFYTYSLAVQPGFEYLEFLQPAHVDPVRYVIVPSPETAAAAVRGGQGITILSRWSVREDINARRLVALALGDQGVSIRWRALVRASDDKRSAARDVAVQLRAFFAKQAAARAIRARAPRRRAKSSTRG